MNRLSTEDRSSFWFQKNEMGDYELHQSDKGYFAVVPTYAQALCITNAANNAVAAKFPSAICINCGEIQHDQIDKICVVCQRRELANLTELRNALHDILSARVINKP